VRNESERHDPRDRGELRDVETKQLHPWIFNNNDLRLLHIFSTIVECGGIDAAESKLDMANSTLSAHLATREDHLQMKLCTRGRAGFALTPEGLAAIKATERMFQRLEEPRRSVQRAKVAFPAQNTVSGRGRPIP